MSDTWMEQRSNMDVYLHAKGDVLIAGLGIGMILLAIQDKPDVRSVTVVEKQAEVIELVKPQLPIDGKVVIVNQDIHDFQPVKRYETIYFDIWDEISRDNLKEMNKLHKKYRKWLMDGGWISSWRRNDCRRE
jgi:spermidine synthase